MSITLVHRHVFDYNFQVGLYVILAIELNCGIKFTIQKLGLALLCVIEFYYELKKNKIVLQKDKQIKL